MILSNDLSIDYDHRTPRAHDDIPHADVDETDTLLGRRGTNSSTTTRTISSSRASRFGLAGFLLAFVALSSSTFLFLLNRGTIVPTSIDDVGTIEAQVAKEQHPSSHESSSSDNVLEVPTSLMNPSFRASETSATSSLPLVPIDSFFDNINGDWTKDGEKRVHMSRSPSSPTCTLNGESGPYPFGEYYCHRESTKSHPFCKSGPNDYCKCWIFPVCLKSNGKNCSKHKGRHQGCHVLIERPTGYKNTIIQDKLSETEWEIYNYYSLMNPSFRASETSNHVPDSSSLSDGLLKQPEVMKTTEYEEDYCPRSDPNNLSEGCQASPDNVYVLTLEKATHETTSTKIQSRLYNGKLPGRTIKIKPGETLKVLFKNELTLQDGTAPCKIDDIATNEWCEPDHSNLHYHGFQGSGEEPSDDSEMVVAPGSSYSYKSVFTRDHLPGTHWVHAHPHGASRLQVGGGAAFALIVEDHETFPIPKEVQDATDVVLVVQHFEEQFILEGFGGINEDDEDAVFKIEKSPNDNDSFRLVNGQYRPTQIIQPGEWQRFRFIYAGWSNANSAGVGKSLPHLNISISTNDHDEKCETNLLAKDGIYVLDYPRPLDTFPIPASGRADIMVRCKKEGTYVVKHLNNEEELFTIKAKGALIESDGPTSDFFEVKNFPRYLQDVQHEPVNPDCSCSTRFTMDESGVLVSPYVPNGIPKVNDKQYRVGDFIHTIKVGEVIERELTGVNEHPYHHHVYPFQLTKGFDKKEWEDPSKDASEGGYFKNGDWHDVIVSVKQKNVTIKYRPIKILGKMMVHCHILAHEDLGMIGSEEIVEDGDCSCDSSTMSHEEHEKYMKFLGTHANKNN